MYLHLSYHNRASPITFTTAATKVFCSQDISQITVSNVLGGTGAYTYAVVAGSATAPLVERMVTTQYFQLTQT
jgi:hypothetical protein